MNPISVERGSKGKEGVEPFAKHPFSVCPKETVKSIQKLSQIVLKPLCRPLFVGRSTWRVWSTPTVGEATMGWSILVTKNHFRVHHSNDEFARGKSHINGIESYWSFAKSRLLQFHGALIRPSICILRKQNSDSIIGMKISIQCYLKWSRSNL